MIARDEQLAVANAMISYGGNFVESLGRALIHADEINALKIKEAWPEYWREHKSLAESDRILERQKGQ